MKKFVCTFILALTTLFISAGASYYNMLAGCQTGWRATGNGGGASDIDGGRYITMGCVCGTGVGFCQVSMSWQLQFIKQTNHGYEFVTIDYGCVNSYGNCGYVCNISAISAWTDADLLDGWGHGTYRMNGSMNGGTCMNPAPELISYTYTWTL